MDIDIISTETLCCIFGVHLLKKQRPVPCLFTKMVEVAGIEPASKKPVTNESTCLVVFRFQL